MTGSAQIVIGGGCFTMLKYVLTLPATELEDHLGFHRGRLGRGFRIAALAPGEVMDPEDFDVLGSTRWEQGLVQTAAGERAIGDILMDRRLDLHASKKRVACYFGKGGGNTPAKVLPNWLHGPDVSYRPGYAGGPWGVPQFQLVRPCRFVVVRQEP